MMLSSPMRLHCTKKLAANLPPELLSGPTPAYFEGANRRLWDWHGHLVLLDRRQCVMFCHDLTRYLLVLPGLRAAEFKEIGRLHRELFLTTIAALGVSSSQLAQLALLLGPLQIDCRTDRSVLGSLRVASDDLQFGYLPRVQNVLDLDPLAMSHQLNTRPCMAEKVLIWPAVVMKKLVEEAVQ
ncbi:MAG: hypothetical protein OEY86_04540 [Nitrospira sp.]|nr:hypothetical protein [Nitrospira sp.]